MQKINWMTIATLGVIGLLLLLLVGGSLFFPVWGGGGNGWRWMDADCGGMMSGWSLSPLGWLFGLIGMLIPLGLLALLIVGGVWLIQQTIKPRPAIVSNCPNCGRAVQADWQLCPNCGHSLTKPAANTVQEQVQRVR